MAAAAAQTVTPVKNDNGTETLQFSVTPITAHAWNGNRTQIALCPNNEEIRIYGLEGGVWSLVETLTGHDQRVMGLDWAAGTGKIVSCSADRNAYVWTKGPDGKWTQSLVLLRINRAATAVKWSPLENKFAVATGARLVSVCYFESEQDWWISKHIRKPIRSTVVSICWHPNNILLATASTDFKCRIFSAYIKGTDAKPDATCWGTNMAMGECLHEFGGSGGGWVRDVSFSPSGNQLAFVGHDSSIYVVNGAANCAVSVLPTADLPLLAVQWLTESSLVVAGHECYPALYRYDAAQGVSFVEKLDVVSEKKADVAGVSAFTLFRQKDTRAIEQGSSAETSLPTVHQNSITQIAIHQSRPGAVLSLSTSGADGRVVIWPLNVLTSAIARLKIV